MATALPLPVTASQVGTYFVGQYYQMLQNQPDFVHQFYSDASTMLRVNGSSAFCYTCYYSHPRSPIQSLNNEVDWGTGMRIGAGVASSKRAELPRHRRRFFPSLRLGNQILEIEFRRHRCWI